MEDTYLINREAAYGVAITGANHITPITVFASQPAIVPSWGLLASVSTALDLEEGTSGDILARGELLTELTDYLEDVFTYNGANELKGTEKDRMDEFRRYSIDFWDAHLSTNYDYGTSDDFGLRFLEDDISVHTSRLLVTAYDRRARNRALVFRDSDLDRLLQFQSDGNVVILKGEYKYSVSPLTASGTNSEFFVQDDSGVVLLKLEGDTAATDYGDLKLKGKQYPSQSSISASSGTKELIVESTESSGPVIRVKLDTNGDLYFTGKMYDQDGEVTIGVGP